MAKYSTPTMGDLLVHEESAIVCREETVITNPTAAPFTAIVGQAVSANGTLVVAGGEAGTTGLLLQEVALGASETTVLKYGTLARGPAAINSAKIAAVDSAGAALNTATIMTAMAALGVVERTEPTVSSTQIN